MGKKSREQWEDGEAVKALFGTDNPYRRRPQPEVNGCDTGVNTQLTKKARLEIDCSAAEKETITEGKFSNAENSDARKRKRDREIIAAALSPRSSDEEPITKKRKKIVVEAEVDGLKKKNNKRKREDVGLEYEKRMFGYVGEEKRPITKKRKKLVVEAEVDGLKKKKNKRKIEDVGLEYEKRKFGYVGEEKRRSSDEETITKKRKKLVVEAEVDGLKKKKNKRKREDAELEYEKRKFGYVGEEKRAATVLAIGEKRKADAAAVDMLVTKGPFDDDDKLLRTVFIGNLPLKTKSKALNREFARFGEIESVRIRSVPLVDAKAPRKAAVIKGQKNEEVDSMNAYIVFKEEQSAHAALSNNMTQIGGNHIRVDMACPPRKKMKGVARLYDRKRTIFVGNLPFDVKDEELYQLFCGLSQSEPNVEAVRVIRDPNTSIGKGIAYVLFKTRGRQSAC